MNQTMIVSDLKDIFASILDTDGVEIVRETTAKDVVGWDSVTHVMLITAIEKKFNVRFKSSEIIAFRNFGDIVDSLEKKLS